MNSKSSKKKGQNTKGDEQETQWTDLAENKAVGEEDKEESEEEEEEYEVEVVVDKMIKKGTVFYKVKWKNYSLEDATWEPEANLDNAPLKIREYENQLLAKKNQDKPTETSKEAPKETPKEAPKETIPKPEVKKEDVKAEIQDDHDKKAAKKAANTKLAAVVQAAEPTSVTGKRDKPSLDDDDDKSKTEEKASKSKKDKSGKKKTEDKPSDKKSTNKKPEAQEKSQPDHEEETINKMRKLSPDNAGQTQAQIIPTQGTTDKNPPVIKHVSKDGSVQNSAEKEQIEKIYDQIFAQAKQGPSQPNSAKGSLPIRTPSSQNAMVEEKDTKNNSVNKTQQQQETNKGFSLSKIMQDEKLMEMSETESINRSEVQENDKKDQASEAGAGSKTKKKGRGEYGALEKGDVPLKVVGIRPVKEDKDLEIMISWKAREDGVKPYNSKVMRIDLLKSGYYMPLIEFYESKMKLEGAPSFDPGMLPKV